MKEKKKKSRRQPIEAAGGIVMRGRVRPLFAVVQLRRQKTWVLPKGKLNRGETALAAAKREAIEETGHDVEVHEFLGSLIYRSSGRPKTVRFWRMQASGRPVAKLMRDVRAVRWLSLTQATTRLTHEREKLFLEKVGREIVRGTGSKRGVRSTRGARHKAAKTSRKRATAAPGTKAPRRADARGHERREPNPVRTAASAGPVQTPNIVQKPRNLIQKLWTSLRR
jgi:8-oxo-dGTP diphosphatase